MIKNIINWLKGFYIKRKEVKEVGIDEYLRDSKRSLKGMSKNQLIKIIQWHDIIIRKVMVKYGIKDVEELKRV